MATNEEIENLLLKENIAADNLRRIQDIDDRTIYNLKGDSSWTEPESAASTQNPPKYPYNNITQTKSGHVFEMDDTPRRERIRIHHRSGTFIEMHPNGDEVHKIEGDGYEIIARNKNVEISGVCNITIKGDSILHVEGNRTELVDGNYNLVVKGDYSLVGQQTVTLGSKDKLSLKGDLLSLKTDTMNISGDLNVDGALEAYTIGTVRLDARSGIGCGIGDPGNPLKGRLPTPPTGIFSATTITAGLGVFAPVGTFGLMDAILMTDLINTTIFDAHIHIGFKGPTGPPIPSMI
jgi:hypothetical protein